MDVDELSSQTTRKWDWQKARKTTSIKRKKRKSIGGFKKPTLTFEDIGSKQKKTFLI